MDSERLAEIRRDYRMGKLDREDLKEDPIEQFNLWLKQACEAEVIEPTAMSLSTVGANGEPSIRTVLLKGLDNRGFVFFTNLESRKATQLGRNSQAALLFPWLALERQVAVTGVAERLPVSEVEKYFATRPRDSRIAACASQQSRVLESRQVLEKAWEQVKLDVAGGEVPLPSFWGGFRVKPLTIQFWQGRSNRLHDRFEYTWLENNSWQIDRLYP